MTHREDRHHRPRPVPPTPAPGNGGTPNVTPAIGTTTDIKIASSNNFLIQDDQLPIDIMTDLIFEDIGGQEVINIARNGSVNGQNVLYQPIKNLTSLALQYNSQNILPVQDTSNHHFDNYSISLEDYVPISKVSDPEYGVDAVYIEEYTSDIIINTVNLQDNQQVEVQIIKYGTSVNDTIY